jgi:hypothetical protein
MVFWLTASLIYLMAIRISVDSDTWWHLRAGKWMLENRNILTVDLFSYTRYGAEWRYPGWLIEVPMAIIESRLGLGGLNLFSALIISTSFALIYSAMQGNELIRATITLLAAIVSSVYWSARPHLMTLLFSALFLYWLENGARNGYIQYRKPLWIGMPLIMFCWVNMHGGFIVGFLIWGVYLVETMLKNWQDALRHQRRVSTLLSNAVLITLLSSGLAMGLVAIANPLGYQIFAYPFQTVSIQKLRDYIQEWQSPDFHSLSVQPFIWMLILLLAVSSVARRRWALRDFLLVAMFLYLSLVAARNVALFALVATLPIARLLEEAEIKSVYGLFPAKLDSARQGHPAKDYPKLNLLILGMVLLGCGYKTATVYPQEVILKAISSKTPIEAVRYLQENRPEGRLFNSYNWGGYLLWSLPEYPVFVDGRTDLYNDEILDQWFQVALLKDGWEQVIERWQIRVILMEKEWIVAKFLQQNGWCQKYLDEVAMILEKCP